jgi:Tol biopolymer transport system component
VRKAAIATAAAMALLMALTAMPAAAKPRAVNGQIVFGRDDPLLQDTVLYTINPDGSHEHQVAPYGLECPHWSHDGSVIVTCGSPDGGATRIIDPDTGSYRDVPMPDPGKYFVGCFVPSPDFERLACEGFSPTDPSLNGIYTIRTSDGGDPRRLSSNTGDDIPGDYSPDGRRLVYDHFPGDAERDGLYVVNVNGTGARKIAPCCTSPGNWSPKGNKIVISRRANPDVHSTIWVLHSDGSGLRQIPVIGLDCGGPNADPAAYGCANPAWSPDGEKIVFRRTTPGVGKGGDLYTINADGTGLTQVTHDGDVEFPDWGTHPLAVG